LFVGSLDQRFLGGRFQQISVHILSSSRSRHGPTGYFSTVEQPRQRGDAKVYGDCQVRVPLSCEALLLQELERAEHPQLMH